ncbi:energy transducer TonB [Chryseobacterium sp. L7]|uniref:Energy transducer TonB n=1 Tax=Chryseobacterium endalhagicum TaxID=2797638 RepID=A0ABS1QKA1_9FLAO|nr:energy transducer TonB [Chryseobacterium endalhagicum]MBL1223049.1 energy transducer TonB [Chryseobacterium endalhagicum]
MKHLNQNQEFRFNEVLFEHRNKEYGAYALRNESDRILTKALFVGVSLLAAISITPFVISAFQSDVRSVGRDGVEIELVDPVVPPDVQVKPPVQIQKPEVQPQKVKTYDASLGEPKAHVTNEKVVEKIEGAVAGPQNNKDGIIATTNYHPVPPQAGTGPAVPYIPPTPPAPKVDDNHIADKGELSAEAVFAGGIDSFRNKVMNSFDGSGFESSGDTMRTMITFIVEKDGTISGIKANGKDVEFNNEAIRTIKNVKGLWKPAKNKQGENVRSYFKFPISMNFEQ